MQMQCQQQGFIQGEGNFPCHQREGSFIYDGYTNPIENRKHHQVGMFPKPPQKMKQKKIDAKSWGLFGYSFFLLTGLKWGIGACQSTVTKLICFKQIFSKMLGESWNKNYLSLKLSCFSYRWWAWLAIPRVSMALKKVEGRHRATAFEYGKMLKGVMFDL